MLIRKVLRQKPWIILLRLFSGRTNFGYCSICNRKTLFVEYAPWLRDNYRCVVCWSIPRQRALIKVLNEQFPDWPSLLVHESSPGGVSSDFINLNAEKYVPSHFFPDISLGDQHDGFQCENLENMTFSDESFDLVITQDVLEHVFNPRDAFSEIARILKPGGAHVFTVPLYKGRKTKVRARLTPPGVEYLEAPDYHGNPIDSDGSLVVTEWGEDFLEFIEKSSGLKTSKFSFCDRNFGLDAQFLDVFVSTKLS